MRVPNKARKSVIFIGSVDDAGLFTPRATAFLVLTHSKGDDRAFPAVVTAEHVISRMQTKGHEIYCRLNMIDGSALVESLEPAKRWGHPESATTATDVAVAPFGIDLNTVDHDYIPLPEYAWDEGSPFKRREFGLGDEVFIVGLFKSHYGKQRNEPIIRIGNIAAMPHEPVHTKYAGDIEAHLIEARSIAGLSGSPVFVNVPETLPIGSFIPDPRYKVDPEDINWMRYNFLGLMHGHFDLVSMTEDSAANDADQSRGINTGIGVVVPARKVLETLYQSGLKEWRQDLMQMYKARKGSALQ
jgi:hypothetical protein